MLDRELAADRGQVSKGIGTNVTTTGGAGTTASVGPRGQVVFNFNASKRLNHKGRAGFRPFEAWVKYDKVLRLKVTVAGGRKGTVTAKLRTATGHATSHGQIIKPQRKVIKKVEIAPAVRRGDELIIPSKAGFTCNATTLHLHQKTAEQGVTVVADWWFRRIGR